jgi:hypothetical protein
MKKTQNQNYITDLTHHISHALVAANGLVELTDNGIGDYDKIVPFLEEGQNRVDTEVMHLLEKIIAQRDRLDPVLVNAAEEFKEKLNFDLTNPENIEQMRALIVYYRETEAKLMRVYNVSK